MDGSDDYFTDDIVFDEETLAVLEHEEQKYRTQTVVSSLPPTKRQRTERGWSPGLGNVSGSQDEIEDLPEISIRDDGFYNVNLASSEIPSRRFGAAPPKKIAARSSMLRYSRVIPQSIQSPSYNHSVPEVRHPAHSRASSLSQRQPNVIQPPQVSSRKSHAPAVDSRGPSATSFLPSSISTSTHAVRQSHLLQEQVEELRRQVEKVVFIANRYFSKFDARIVE
jgi:hypothetical protein